MKKLQKIGGFAIALLMATTILVPAFSSAQVTTNMCAGLVRDLTLGSTGSDVVTLQTFLEQKGYLTMPAGVSKGYFGALTRSAVAKYQAANGISPTAGYFGPLTRGKLVAACATTSTPGNGGGNNNGGNNNGGLNGGEASLEAFDFASGNDSDVEEGSSSEIAEIEFDVEDGDILIDRVDLRLVANGSNEEEDPWDTFDSVRLLVDGDEIAEADLSDEDEYLDEDDGTFRISGIDYKVEEGESVTIVVELTAQNSVDGADNNLASWTINVEDDGIRATDAEGIQQYVGEDSETVTFDIEVEGDGEELSVSSSSEDPESTTLQVKDDEKSDAQPIFAFDLSAEESDVEIDSVQIQLESDVSIANLVHDLILEIDGEEFDDWSFVGSGTSTRTVEFDIDGDYTLSEDDEVTVVLLAEFNAANGSNYSSGATIEASILDSAIEGEGSDDIVSDGAATGDVHDLLIAGLAVEDAPTTDSDSEDGIGTFTFELDLTAFEDDVTIAQNAAGAADNNGFDWSVVGGSAVSSATIQSDADLVGGNYVIEEGNTETFTITITVDPTSAGSYYVVLNDVTYEVNGDTVTHAFQPQSDYDTRAVSISN